ncbi:MAG: Xaa-Pro peptidase family protein [Bacillota bacterium]
MSRTQTLRERMAREGVNALLVTRPENRLYLSGFSGSAGALLVFPDAAYLLTDFRYLEQAQEQSPDFTVVKADREYHGTVSELMGKHAATTLGFEKDHVTFGMYQMFKDKLPGVELVGVSGWVEQLRRVKDPGEIEKIARAQSLVDQGFGQLLEWMAAGMSEEEVALELECMLRRLGARRMAFEIIVVSGPRASLPHGQPTGRRLGAGDLVTIDVGVTLDGYCCDMTRTVVVGAAGAEEQRIYNVVLRAQEAALEAIKPGLTGVQVDAVARDIIGQAGLGERFGHGLGHGVGLAVHEGPGLSPLAPADVVLEAGNVVTVEPGVYIPGWGGVRIEDLVVVTAGGCRNLTASPKHLIAVRA